MSMMCGHTFRALGQETHPALARTRRLQAKRRRSEIKRGRDRIDPASHDA